MSSSGEWLTVVFSLLVKLQLSGPFATRAMPSLAWLPLIHALTAEGKGSVTNTEQTLVLEAVCFVPC